MKRRRRFLLIAAVFLTVLIWDLDRFVSKILAAPADPPEQVDLVAVLTGGQGRLREALVSFSSGAQKYKYLLISGVAQEIGLSEILAANSIESFPDELRSRVIIDHVSKTTPDNVREIIQLVKKEKLTSIQVITSNYHLPRTMRLLEREIRREQDGLPKLAVYQSAVESPNFPPNAWWLNGTAWQILFSEYFKNLTIL